MLTEGREHLPKGEEDLPEGRNNLPEGLVCLRGPPRGPGVVGRHSLRVGSTSQRVGRTSWRTGVVCSPSRRDGSGPDALPEGREWLGGNPKGMEWLGGPPGGPGLLGKPSL